MAYEIQAKGSQGDWAADYISGDGFNTVFDTRQEALEEIRYLREFNTQYEGEYRIVRLPEDDTD